MDVKDNLKCRRDLTYIFHVKLTKPIFIAFILINYNNLN